MPAAHLRDRGCGCRRVRLFQHTDFGRRFRPIQLFLSESMANTKVEIRFDENDAFSVIYRNYKIASVDAIEGKLLDRHIRRL